MQNIFERIHQIGVVPVIQIDDADKAAPLVKAIAEGGIPCAEVTFRTAQAEEAIRRMAHALPDILLGAGTVLTTTQADKAIEAGAKFIVTPGFNPRVVEYCVEQNYPVIPGCMTPSDMEQAIESGLDMVKFFPAEQCGGLDYIKAVSAPYPMLRFMPFGGINAGNIGKYLSFDKVFACGGSWLAAADLIRAGDYAEITRRCAEAVQTIAAVRNMSAASTK